MINCVILCPTYRESLTLRQVLIRQHIGWVSPFFEGDIKDNVDWKRCWDRYKSKTVYIIKAGILYINSIDHIKMYTSIYNKYKQLTVEEYVENN